MTTLLVAATGGHLTQLHLRHRDLDRLPGPFHWVTFERPQSLSLLAGQRRSFVPFIGSRDPLGALRGLPIAHSVVRRYNAKLIVSTGSAIALPYMIAGRAHGARCMYIESAARTEGPSLTGRLLQAVPGVELYSQYEGWSDARWRLRGSVFDLFQANPEVVEPPARPMKILVTLGTLEFPFPRLIERLGEVLPSGAEVVIQHGGTELGDGHGYTAHRTLPAADLEAAVAAADVVIAHAGVGSAMSALRAGKAPILVPRRHAYGEHVDDHQRQIASELSARGLAIGVEADRLSAEQIEEAARRAVTRA